MDNKISNIKERVLQISKYKGITRETFFNELDVSYANFKGQQKKTALSSDTIAIILSKYPDVDPEWLLTGKGTMLRRPKKPLKVSEDDLEYYHKGIPLIPIDAMAGIGRGEISINEIDCERYVVPEFKQVDFLIRVSGDSMLPKYSSGDIVACKNVPINDIFFQWNRVYVLDTDQGAMIKRVKKLTSGDRLLLISENIAYEPIEISLKKIHSVAIVVGTIRLD